MNQLKVFENTDIRKFGNDLLNKIDLITIDISFISVTKIMPKIPPKNQTIVPETPIMTKVSCRQCKNSPESRLKLGIKVITKFSIILIPPVAHLSF